MVDIMYLTCELDAVFCLSLQQINFFREGLFDWMQDIVIKRDVLVAEIEDVIYN